MNPFKAFPSFLHLKEHVRIAHNGVAASHRMQLLYCRNATGTNVDNLGELLIDREVQHNKLHDFVMLKLLRVNTVLRRVSNANDFNHSRSSIGHRLVQSGADAADNNLGAGENYGRRIGSDSIVFKRRSHPSS